MVYIHFHSVHVLCSYWKKQMCTCKLKHVLFSFYLRLIHVLMPLFAYIIYSKKLAR